MGIAQKNAQNNKPPVTNATIATPVSAVDLVKIPLIHSFVGKPCSRF
jgi:hypothetical protein